MGASLARFIPFNEAGAGFAGDATGLWGWVGLLLGGVTAGQGVDAVSLFHCFRRTRPGAEPNASARQVEHSPFNPHVNPLFGTWAASPTYRTEG